MRCKFCTAPAYLPQVIKPPLCPRHHEMIILIARCRRMHVDVTAANLVKLLQQINGRSCLTTGEIPQLLAQMQEIEAHHAV